MNRKKYPLLTKSRREHFGGIIFREHPGFLAYIDEAYADFYNIPYNEKAVLCAGVFSSPLDAHLALTTACNLYCRGCYNTNKQKPIKYLSWDLAKKIIDKLSELNVFSVSFGGGEPTLHPDLIKIAEYAREKQVLPNITTNGLTMTEEFAEKCAVFGNVHFSLHHPQDWDHVLPAISNYRKATKRKPGLNLLLTSKTLPILEDIISQARKSGCLKILFLRYKTTANNPNDNDLNIDNQLVKLIEKLRLLDFSAKQMMFLFDCSIFETLASNSLLDVKTCQKYDYNGCQGGNAYIAIDVDGNYKPCSFGGETFGSILDLDYQSWIQNSKLSQFRNQTKNSLCAECEFSKLCNGGCRILYE